MTIDELWKSLYSVVNQLIKPIEFLNSTFVIRHSSFRLPRGSFKHFGGLLENSLRKTNDGIDHQKSNDPKQQHGQYKKSKTVFYKINQMSKLLHLNNIKWVGAGSKLKKLYNMAKL